MKTKSGHDRAVEYYRGAKEVYDNITRSVIGIEPELKYEVMPVEEDRSVAVPVIAGTREDVGFLSATHVHRYITESTREYRDSTTDAERREGAREKLRRFMLSSIGECLSLYPGYAPAVLLLPRILNLWSRAADRNAIIKE